MRVLHVIETLGIGGAEVQLLKLLCRMDSESFEQHVCYLYGASDLKADFESCGIGVHPLSLSYRYSWLEGAIKLGMLARKLRPDIIHTYLFNANVVGRLSKPFIRKPLLCTFTGLSYEPARYEHEDLSRFKHSIVRLIDSVTARIFVDRFVAVTPYVGESMASSLHLKADRITVIPRGLEESWGRNIQDGPPEDLAEMLRDRWPVLINVGRLVGAKGQRFAIEAVAVLKEKYPDILLLIAGEGPMRGRLEHEVRKHGVDGNVVLLGTRKDVPRLLKAADIFVFSSVYEGAANSIVEAAGMGKPCVAFGIPSITGVVSNEFCLLAEPGSAMSLATRIDELCGMRGQWPMMAESAARWVRKRNDFGAIAAQMERLYTEVAHGSD